MKECTQITIPEILIIASIINTVALSFENRDFDLPINELSQKKQPKTYVEVNNMIFYHYCDKLDRSLVCYLLLSGLRLEKMYTLVFLAKVTGLNLYGK